MDDCDYKAEMTHAEWAEEERREELERALAESRAEVDSLRSRLEDTTRDKLNAEARAERLAGALRGLLGSVDDLTSYMAADDEIGYRPCCNVLSYNPHADDCATARAYAALEQEPQE